MGVTICDQFSQGYLFQSILKSFDGKWPEKINYGVGALELKNSDLNFLVSPEKLEVSLNYKDSLFKKDFFIDEVKKKKSRRYIFNILVKVIKEIKIWIDEK